VAGMVGSILDTIKRDENFLARGDVGEIAQAYLTMGKNGQAWFRWACAWQIRNGPFGMLVEQPGRGNRAGKVTTSLRKVLGPVGRGAFETFLFHVGEKWEATLTPEELLKKLGPSQKELGGWYPKYRDANAPKPAKWGEGKRVPLGREQYTYGDEVDKVAEVKITPDWAKTKAVKKPEDPTKKDTD